MRMLRDLPSVRASPFKALTFQFSTNVSFMHNCIKLLQKPAIIAMLYVSSIFYFLVDRLSITLILILKKLICFGSWIMLQFLKI